MHLRSRIAWNSFATPAMLSSRGSSTSGRERVAVKPRIPYRHALELQMEADVLLLLQSSDQRDEGNIPAKLFEYLYARRPILFIGYERGIAARLVIERRAGLVSNCPVRIRDQLRFGSRTNSPAAWKARPFGQSWPWPRRSIRQARTPLRRDCPKRSHAPYRRPPGDGQAVNLAPFDPPSSEASNDVSSDRHYTNA